jgi:uncharacterized membrane protein
MGVLYYLALVLGLFGGCWVMVGEYTARWLFMTVHFGCAMAILLLYMRELLSRRLAEAQSIETTTSSRQLHS